jgi:hypothetical protein
MKIPASGFYLATDQPILFDGSADGDVTMEFQFMYHSEITMHQSPISVVW